MNCALKFFFRTWTRARSVFSFLLPARFVSVSLLIAVLPMASMSARQAKKSVTFTTARQAHSLSKEEAERAYPVRLQGVITYFDRYRDPDKAFLFLNDGSGSIYVTLPKEWKLPLHPGQLVTVEGVTGPGHFAPIVDSTRILILRESSLPRAAPLISVAAMLTGSEDGKWLESRGVVRFVARDKGGLQLDLQTNAGLIRVFVSDANGVDPAWLVDSTVVVRGNCAPFFNEKRQLIGVRLFVPALSLVRVEKASPADVFSLPPAPSRVSCAMPLISMTFIVCAWREQ
jgi:hypothetical protein